MATCTAVIRHFRALVLALSDSRIGYSIVYDLAGIVISNRTYSASDGDTSGYSDIWDY